MKILKTEAEHFFKNIVDYNSVLSGFTFGGCRGLQIDETKKNIIKLFNRET